MAISALTEEARTKLAASDPRSSSSSRSHEQATRDTEADGRNAIEQEMQVGKVHEMNSTDVRHQTGRAHGDEPAGQRYGGQRFSRSSARGNTRFRISTQRHDGERNEEQLHVEGGIRRVLRVRRTRTAGSRRGVQREPRPHQHERLFEGFQRNSLTDAEQPQVDRRIEADQRAEPERVKKKNQGVPRRAPPIRVSMSPGRFVPVVRESIPSLPKLRARPPCQLGFVALEKNPVVAFDSFFAGKGMRLALQFQ